MLRPLNVPLGTLLAIIAHTFINLRSFKLKNVSKIGDEDLVNLGKVSTFTCLSVAPCKWHFVRVVTDSGFEHLVSLMSLIELSLSHCSMISDESSRHLGSVMALNDLNLDIPEKLQTPGCNIWHLQFSH